MEESKYRPYLEEFESSGLSIRKFCEGKNLCADGFYYFYKRHKEKAVVAVIKPKTDREMNDRLSIKTNVEEMPPRKRNYALDISYDFPAFGARS